MGAEYTRQETGSIAHKGLPYGNVPFQNLADSLLDLQTRAIECDFPVIPISYTPQMSSPFEPLIPLPSTSTSPSGNQTARTSQHKPQDESDIDRFAALFNPQTPPASPNLKPIFPDSKPTTTNHSHTPIQTQNSNLGHAKQVSLSTPSSTGSDFGFFVSVPPAQDPLSESMFPTSPTTGLQVISDSSRTLTPKPSLNFFEQFIEDAKERNAGRGKGYLDELLKHEDDPLYWVRSAGGGSGSEAAEEEGGGLEKAMTSCIETSLLDLDLNVDPSVMLTVTGNDNGNVHSDPTVHTLPSKPKGRPFTTPSLSQPYTFSTRSPPQFGIPRRASSSASTAVPTHSHTHEFAFHSHSVDHSASSSFTLPPPMTSYPTGSLTPRWMSSLLSSSRPQSSSIDEQFQPSSQTISRGSRSSSFDTLDRINSRSQNIPPTAATSSSTPQSPSTAISHGTPFASKRYVPPTGAPGFTVDRFWDKGFSNDFDKERVERKTIKLEGRKMMTTSVLEDDLAYAIRSHLPALARLPRTWTLLYSLDQHGISLNTLYTRCEPQGPTSSQPKGSLVVLKDSGDAVFGAWLGEGVKMSKGSYYGSGES